MMVSGIQQFSLLRRAGMTYPDTFQLLKDRALNDKNNTVRCAAVMLLDKW